jgi:TLD
MGVSTSKESSQPETSDDFFASFTESIADSNNMVTPESLTSHLPINWQSFGVKIYQGITQGSTEPQSKKLFQTNLEKYHVENLTLTDCVPLLYGPGIEIESVEKIPCDIKSKFMEKFHHFIRMRSVHPETSNWFLGKSEIVISGEIENSLQYLVHEIARLEMIDITPTLLFNSNMHGLSLKTLTCQCNLYKSKVILLLQDTRNRIFGCFFPKGIPDDLSWDTKNTETFLFQLKPEIRLRKWSHRESARNFIHISKKGIHIGGTFEMSRLYVDDSLSSFQSVGMDATFESQQLLSIVNEEEEEDELISGKVKIMEIWGLGGEEAMQEFERRKQDLQEIRMERKKVDKARILENDFDKEMFLGKTFNKPKEEGV